MNTIQDKIENFYNNVQQISDDKKYWLIRTQSGELYDTFSASSYISIGYNEISLEVIHNIRKANVEDFDVVRHIKNLVIDTYEEEKRPGLVASQIFNFTYKIKKGDTVIIPSENSAFVYFGVVEETNLMAVNQEKDDDCPYYRRKRIKWIKQVKRRELEPSLFNMFFSHNTVNDISKYAKSIESTINDYFIRDNEEHLIFNVERNEDIGAIDLFQLGYCLLNLTNDFFNENGLEFDINDFDVKINLNSKGKIKFITNFGRGAFILGLMTLFINGGGGTFDFKGNKIDLKTDGLIQKIIDYQNNKSDRAMIEKIFESIDSLEIKKPEDAINMYKQFSTNKSID